MSNFVSYEYILIFFLALHCYDWFFFHLLRFFLVKRTNYFYNYFRIHGNQLYVQAIFTKTS